jgi:hypothetical protein
MKLIKIKLRSKNGGFTSLMLAVERNYYLMTLPLIIILKDRKENEVENVSDRRACARLDPSQKTGGTAHGQRL